MPRKLNPSLVAKIKRLQAKGLSHEEIAAKTGVSRGTVGNAVRQVTKRTSGSRGAATVPAPVVEVEPGETPSLADQLAWLGQIASQRRADATRLRAAGDDIGAARATRDAIQAAALLAKNTPRPEDDGTQAEFEQAAATARLKILERIRRAASGHPEITIVAGEDIPAGHKIVIDLSARSARRAAP